MNLKARLLGSWIGDQLLRDVVVESITDLGTSFRRVKLAGSALVGANVSAGDKVQVFLPDIGARTFTPFAANTWAGSFELAVYCHAAEPAARWARGLAPGSTVRLISPRSSTPLAGRSGPIALFGDETSLGIAFALRAIRTDALVRIGVTHPVDVQPVADALNLPPGSVASRGDLLPVARELIAATDNHGTLVLTGGAPSIQLLRGHLRTLGSRHAQVVKAYWSPGKRGLD
jgi:ferric-chelate reductase (NADPH)